MSKSPITQISEIQDFRLAERNLPDGRPGVSLVLPIKTKTGGVNEVEIVLSADLAVRHGKALVELGTALGGRG